MEELLLTADEAVRAVADSVVDVALRRLLAVLAVRDDETEVEDVYPAACARMMEEIEAEKENDKRVDGPKDGFLPEGFVAVAHEDRVATERDDDSRLVERTVSSRVTAFQLPGSCVCRGILTLF